MTLFPVRGLGREGCWEEAPDLLCFAEAEVLHLERKIIWSQDECSCLMDPGHPTYVALSHVQLAMQDGGDGSMLFHLVRQRDGYHIEYQEPE